MHANNEGTLCHLREVDVNLANWCQTIEMQQEQPNNLGWVSALLKCNLDLTKCTLERHEVSWVCCAFYQGPNAKWRLLLNFVMRVLPLILGFFYL
jgi:hypothetical protein